MTFYLILFIVVGLLFLCGYWLPSNYWVILIGLVLATIAGLRMNTGLDYTAYQELYTSIQIGADVFTIPHFEIGYLILNWLSVQASIPFDYFLLLYAFVTLGLLTIFLVKLDNPRFACMVWVYYFARFYFTRDFGQIRSSLAIVISLFAVSYLIKKKWTKFTAVILIASLFQRVALVILVVAFFINMIVKKLNVITYATIIILSMILSRTLSSWLQSKSILFEDYSVYLTSEAFGVGQNGLLNPIIWMQVVITFSIIWLYFQTRFIDTKFESSSIFILNRANIQKITVLYVVGTVILLIFNTLPTLAGRVSTILSTMEVFLVPLVFQKISNKYICPILFVLFSFSIWYLMFNHLNLSSYIPYTTFIQ